MKQSAGLLVYRRRGNRTQVLLVHPGGPFWAKKDEGAWSIPKGEFDPGEDPLEAAKREFDEETGLSAESALEGPFIALPPRKQPSGKVLHVWAAAGDPDISAIRSNLFSMEWPPHSGQMREFPEVDRAEWFSIAEAREKLHKGQAAFLDDLRAALRARR